ncbi:unnamed protein product [Ectocarpus fasciculatus]
MSKHAAPIRHSPTARTPTHQSEPTHSSNNRNIPVDPRPPLLMTRASPGSIAQPRASADMDRKDIHMHLSPCGKKTCLSTFEKSTTGGVCRQQQQQQQLPRNRSRLPTVANS